MLFYDCLKINNLFRVFRYSKFFLDLCKIQKPCCEVKSGENEILKILATEY